MFCELFQSEFGKFQVLHRKTKSSKTEETHLVVKQKSKNLASELNQRTSPDGPIINIFITINGIFFYVRVMSVWV